MPSSFVHVCLRVRDIDRSVAFYEALGFELRGRLVFAEAFNTYLGLPGGPDCLELTVNVGHDGPYDIGSGFGHLAVTVDDLDGTLAGLEGRGIVPGRPPFAPGGREEFRIAFVEDPDGYQVELIDGGRFAPPMDPPHPSRAQA